MDPVEFQRVTRSHVVEYLATIQRMQGATNLASGEPITQLYPSSVLFTETPTHFTVDLLGATETFSSKLEVFQRTSPSISEVLGSFEAPATTGMFVLTAGSGANAVEDVAITSQRTLGAFERRYPDFMQSHGSSINSSVPVPRDHAFSAFEFKPGFKDLWLSDVLIVNDWQGVVRARYFQAFWMIEREATAAEYRTRLRDMHPIGTPRTVLLPPAASDQGRTFVNAAAFATLSAFRNVGETTITTFLEQQAEILTRALGGVKLIPQPRFPWIDGNPDPSEGFIQPDFLLVDADSRAHICEFKLPLVGDTTLTAGRHKRRRFRYPVADGIAQLANYQEYFKYDAHRIYLEELNISMDDPRCILVIGSNENFVDDEVREAMRMLATIEIYDYDTLRVLYAAASSPPAH